MSKEIKIVRTPEQYQSWQDSVAKLIEDKSLSKSKLKTLDKEIDLMPSYLAAAADEFLIMEGVKG